MISMQIYSEVSNKVEVFIENVKVLRRKFNYQYPGVNVEKVLNTEIIYTFESFVLHNCFNANDS